MKKTRFKIAFLVGAVVMLTLLLSLLVFNFVMHRNIRKEAEDAVSLALEEETLSTSLTVTDVISEINNIEDLDDLQVVVHQVFDELSEDESMSIGEYTSTDHGLYAADTLIIPLKDQEVAMEMELLYSQKERRIAMWCRENDSAKFSRREIGGQDYYLQSRVSEDGSEMIVSYVDVTGEYDMIYRVNVTLLLAALAIGLIGCFAGYMLGRKMEQTQLAQKQFFENTSHELKTPLTAIRGYAEGIETGVITDYRKTGRVISAQVEEMSNLVEGILSIARIESGALPLKKEEVDMPQFIQDCLMPFEGAVKSRGLSVSLNLSPGTIQADPAQLEHAVTNLFTNAMKYAVSRIRVTCRPGEISIWNDLAEVDEEEMKHIFDRFHTGKNGNTGIGLALAKEIIGLHGWKITAEAADGGILFRICE